MNPLDSFVADLADVPAIVGSGLPGLRRSRYLLIHIDDAQAALAWLRQVLALDVVHSVQQVRCGKPGRRWWQREREDAPQRRSERVEESVTLAFSHAGLCALGAEDDPELPFPSAFRTGMASPLRRSLLGDEPEPWRWGDAGEAGEFTAHMLVAHCWEEDVEPAPALDPAALPAGLRVLAVSSCPSYVDPMAPGAGPAMYEPFGFRDGIGQPVLAGLALSTFEHRAREAAGAAFDDRVVQPGEFVLGQLNEYTERAYAPSLRHWPGERSADGGFGRNGSYLAVRQIAQHVSTFHDFVAAHPALQGGAALVGRHAADGRSLLGVARAPSEIDAFRYLQTDANGFECPRGAHTRRAQPRDALSHSVARGIASSKLHRLLRRGRVYTEACTAGGAIDACHGLPAGRDCKHPCGHGLMFVALAADLERQFEFVQRTWINGARFGDLSDEPDPLLGTSPQRAFSLQGCPVGQRIEALPRFTTVLGGGYFFAPGLRALRWLAEGKQFGRS